MQATLLRFVLDEGAVADTLDPTAHHDVADNAVAQAISPVSMKRAPIQRDADRRSIERM